MRHFFVVCLQKYSYCVCGNIPDVQRELEMCVNVFSFVFELVLTEKSMRNAINLGDNIGVVRFLRFSS